MGQIYLCKTFVLLTLKRYVLYFCLNGFIQTNIRTEFVSQLFSNNNKTTSNPRQTQKHSNLNLKKIICLYGKETNEIQSNLSWKNKEWWLWA